MMRQPHSGFMRIACIEPCELTLDDRVQRANLWNLSALGVYVVLPHAPPRGASVRIRFSLPADEQPIEARGLVAWCNPPAAAVRSVGGRAFDLPPGCGIEFAEIAAEDRRRIQRRVLLTYPDSAPIDDHVAGNARPALAPPSA